MVHPVFANLPTTIFEVMSGLCRETGAVNLGQGFPDDPGPEAVRRKAAEEVLSGWNQYPPMRGIPELRRAVADHYLRRQGLDLDWEREVTVTSGATEALAAAFFSLLEEGDEVVLFQPLYDAYLPLVRRAGGVPKLVNLKPPHWRLEREALEAAITDRTRMVVLNNPHNPAAVVFPDEDLAMLAELCVRHDVIAVCDEVWEQVMLDGRTVRPLISDPGMRERTVKIGSAGKLFAMTGWKVGWLVAAPELTKALAGAHQFLTFTTPPNLQAAVAWGLPNSDHWFDEMPVEMSRARSRLADGLTAEGFAVLPAQGTYFVNLDLAASGIALDDYEFAMRAVKEAGIGTIPVSVFYDEEPVRTVVRLCFAKRDETIDAGIDRLARAKKLFS